MTKSKYRRNVILWLLLLTGISLKGQIRVNDQIGISGGLTFTFGTTVNRIGIAANAYWVDDFVQINFTTRVFYGFTHLGPRPNLPGPEIQLSIGAVAGFGPPKEEPNPILSVVSNQTGRTYAAGYAFNLYWDKRQTSQRSGTIAIELNQFQIATENDMLAGGLEDKFRTGTLSFAYRKDQAEYGMKVVLWTGNSRSPEVTRVRKSKYPSRFGYKNVTKGTYGKFSHGILTLGVKYAFDYGQTGSAQIGIDSEYVRHFLQNRFIHDMWFVPRGLTKAKNPHYPMLTDDGKPFLYKEGQRVKPASFFFSLGLNEGMYY